VSLIVLVKSLVFEWLRKITAVYKSSSDIDRNRA